jgi:hypothetical protein
MMEWKHKRKLGVKESHKGKVELDVVTSSLFYIFCGTGEISVGIKPLQRDVWKPPHTVLIQKLPHYIWQSKLQEF